MGSPEQASASDGAASQETPEQQQHQQQGAPPRDYQKLYEEIKGRPCRVDRISKLYERDEAKPLRTRQHLIDRELERVYDANTLEEIHEALEQAGRNLSKLAIFQDVQMLVHEDPEDDPELVSVMVNVEEKNWYKLHAATYVQGEETSCELGVGLHNVSGNAEHLTVSGEIGTQRSTQLTASYEQPKPYDLPVTTNMRLSQLVMNNQKSSSHLELFRAIAFGIRSFNDSHGLEYELGWRRLSDPTGLASRAILSQVGDYVKSALKHTWNGGSRSVDATTGQLSGWAAKATSELSGLGFDERMRFAKTQVDWQALLPVTSHVSLSLSAAAGLMLPWGGDWAARPTCISDRFFLGNPTLRGFKIKSIGATDMRRPARPAAAAAGDAADQSAAVAKVDSLGGDVFASMTAALLMRFPQPALRALNVQGQLFVNGGNCVQLTGTGRSVQSNLQDFSRTLRWSCGAGLMLPTAFGRFELNYVVLLSHQEQDRIKQGFQMGFAGSPLL